MKAARVMGQIAIYRGSHQIGGCATEISTENHWILIDLGANLPDTENDGLTDDELLQKAFANEKCDGILFTHYHGDHIGLYKKAPWDISMYIGPTVKKIMEILTETLDRISGNTDNGLLRIQGMRCYTRNKKIMFGDIAVTPFSVDHSALVAYMFLIEASGKKILFTGDFREHGIVGKNNRLEKAINAYIGEVDILITEGTMLSRIEESKHNPIKKEDDLGKRVRELFKTNNQSVILASSTNLDSIMEFYHALPWGMDFVCDAYQAKIMLAAMEDKGEVLPGGATDLLIFYDDICKLKNGNSLDSQKYKYQRSEFDKKARPDRISSVEYIYIFSLRTAIRYPMKS